ncbi:GLPGLI family protein [Elizabethkingia sp. HvH-WGS333]|uniref:GLPGLI family protein n=1 Tax=Elizabethkingia TaxID=308865 RepID=UPI0007415AF0|nr:MULTISPECIES: GLPGLI family protein [Elizabethkingia]KUG13039.1 hypothetical protein AMC91_04955 [Elizabethkingia miricola]MCL1656867.1 GLPGLI family protein [Elizabethkingia miricola]OIK44611.1 GLPGLI family protein [Elizabethkingia sp. HvH-WGS333]
MKYIFSFSFFFAFVFCYTQEFKFADNASFKPFPYSVESLDTSYQNIYYQLSFANNSEKPDSKKQAVCILELGKTKSKFFDFNSVKSDSLTKKYSVEKEITGKELTAMLAYKTNWENVLIRDIQTKNIIFQDHASKTFQYEGTQPELKWNLEKESKTILGYTCHKATTEYRGRKYTAWYTTDIPISSGPYVFEGLPGLILAISDSKDHFNFTAIAMDKNPREIYLNNGKYIIKVSRDQFRKVQKNYHSNPGFYINGGAYNADGTEVKVDPRYSKPYNPIELE